MSFDIIDTHGTYDFQVVVMPTEKAMCFLSSAFSACNRQFPPYLWWYRRKLGSFVESTISCSFIRCIFLLDIMEYSQRLLPSYVHGFCKRKTRLTQRGYSLWFSLFTAFLLMKLYLGLCRQIWSESQLQSQIQLFIFFYLILNFNPQNIWLYYTSWEFIYAPWLVLTTYNNKKFIDIFLTWI